MSALWVWLELAPLVTLLLLVCVAVLARDGKPGPSARQGENDEPEWWSEFEQEFALYVAKKTGHMPSQRRRES